MLYNIKISINETIYDLNIEFNRESCDIRIVSLQQVFYTFYHPDTYFLNDRRFLEYGLIIDFDKEELKSINLLLSKIWEIM